MTFKDWVPPTPYRCEKCIAAGIQCGAARFEGQPVPVCPNEPDKHGEMTPSRRMSEQGTA